MLTTDEIIKQIQERIEQFDSGQRSVPYSTIDDIKLILLNYDPSEYKRLIARADRTDQLEAGMNEIYVEAFYLIAPEYDECKKALNKIESIAHNLLTPPDADKKGKE